LTNNLLPKNTYEVLFADIQFYVLNQSAYFA